MCSPRNTGNIYFSLWLTGGLSQGCPDFQKVYVFKVYVSFSLPKIQHSITKNLWDRLHIKKIGHFVTQGGVKHAPVVRPIALSLQRLSAQIFAMPSMKYTATRFMRHCHTLARLSPQVNTHGCLDPLWLSWTTRLTATTSSALRQASLREIH